MSRVLIALIVGAAIGAAVFLFQRKDGAPPAVPVQIAPSDPAVLAMRPSSSRAFVSPTHPGLVVTVTRGAEKEAQARVQLSRSSRSLITSELAWEPAGTETTDGEGRAEFPALTGRYFVVATARDGSRTVESVDISRADAPTYVTLTLKPPVLFGGQVVDAASRRPLPGATLRADPQTEREDGEVTLAVGSGITDSLGRFGLELPAPNVGSPGGFEHRWRIEARAPGYLPNEETAEQPTKDLVIALTKGVEVSGLVVDAAGQPVSGATLRIAPGDTTSLTTDPEGKFVFIAPHQPVSMHALAPDGRQGLARVLLGEKQDTAQVRIVVGDGAELTGLVRDTQGPVLHADVRVIAEPESLEVAAFDTPLDGRFAAKGLPPGRYSVRAQQGLGRRATVVGLELPVAAPVELVLSGSGRVTGVVTGAEGNPAEGAHVTIQWPRGLNEVRRTARTGPDGRFDFDDLLPAEVSVQAQLDDQVSEEVGTYVAPGATVELALVAAPQGRLAGTVTGPPIHRVMVRNDRPGGEFIEVNQTDRTFEKRVAPGTWRIFAEVKGENANEFQFIESITAVVRAGELTTVVLNVPGSGEPGDGGIARVEPRFGMHPELGSGMSFENSPGGVRVDFLMGDCPAAKAGVRIGDLVVSIDGEATRNALDAFARVRKPSEEAPLELLVRRDGQDLKLSVR